MTCDCGDAALLPVHRGDAVPFAIELEADGGLIILDGLIEWRATYQDREIAKSTADGSITLAGDELTEAHILLTPADTDKVPVGRLMPWTLRRTVDGLPATLATGYLRGR